MRVPVRAGLVLAAVALLAACGSVAAPIVSGPHVHPGGTRLVLASPGPPAGSRAEAVTLARRMLSRLRMPAGARRLPPPVPRPLREPDLWAGAAAALDLHQLFEPRQPVGAVAAGLMAQVPAGMSLGSTGALVEPAGVASREVGYAARQVPAGVYAAQLVVTVASARSGGSWVRADAQVIWFPPRTAAEYIDLARYHVLAIAVEIASPRQHTVHKVVTSRAVISRLAGALNRAPVQPVAVPNCPAIFAYYRLAFAVSRHSRPGVVVLATRGPCGGAQIRAGGQQQPPLEDDGAVVTAVDRLLGVTPGP